MYKYLFWDIDGTILNFEAAEYASIKKLFKKYNFIECTDEMVDQYVKINDKYWEMLERGEMLKKDILVNRFKEFFSLYSIDPNYASDFNDDYQKTLGETICFNDDALNILKEEKNKYILVAITNGTKIAQTIKLRNSTLDQVFDKIYISENVGYEKPNIKYFEYVLKDLNIADKKEILIIGDSLTSDILGGVNANIDTCFYNKKNKINKYSYAPTYEIKDLHDLKSIIEK